MVSKTTCPTTEYDTFKRSLLASGIVGRGNNIQFEKGLYSLRHSGDSRLLGNRDTEQDAERRVYEQVKNIMPYE